MSALEKTILKNKLPPLPTGFGARRGSGSFIHKRHDYNPISWSQYWDTRDELKIGDDTFCVYKKGNTGPLLVLLHGGGYSALTWSLFAESVTSMVPCQVMAFDQRGHGDTVTSNDEDLSAETMAKDVGNVITAVYGSEYPPTILIGHSMGGAIAVHAAHDQHATALAGLVVIDVVEGTAMEALSSMQSFLRGRPQQFSSLQNAVEWSVRSGQTRNLESARVSMPGQIKNIQTNKCGTTEVDTTAITDPPSTGPHKGPSGHSESLRAPNAILEENEEQDGISSGANLILVNNYSWRINLGQTEKFWSGWFKDLSKRFLESSPLKMLLLAGIDRLDTDLTVGQMQGKFQMQVLPQCGHAVHEDVPDRVAEVLANFLIRHRLSEPHGELNNQLSGC